MSRKRAILIAGVVGCVVMGIPTLLQPYFKAGSVPDGICEVLLLPGKLIATPFHDRGSASPEFLWRARLATIALFGGAAYWLMRRYTNARA
jgi:hypothetical protein